MNVTAHPEKEKNEKRKQEKKKTGDQFLEMLCAALLRLFRGQHGEKMKESAWGNLDLQEG